MTDEPSFTEATAVAAAGSGQWSGAFAPGWDILGNTNGGYTLAVASRAASASEDGRLPVSVTGHFVRRARTGPITVRTETVRSGRRFSVVRSDISQDGAVVLATIGTYSADPGTAETLLADATPVDLPPPEKCERVTSSKTGPFPPPSMDRFEMRAGPNLARMAAEGPTGQARIDGWLRLHNNEPFDAHALIMATDAFPPTAFNAGLPVGWTPTLELTVHLRATRVVGWLKCEYTTRFVSGGYLEEDGLIWDENDNLVAQSRQLALVSQPQ
ncbi:MAG: thioesterase family protein [Acidimicrobiia bacterium]